MTERYIFLGTEDGTIDILYFLHVIENKIMFKSEISHHLYNCLMHKKFITSAQQVVVVFEFHSFYKTIKAICIQHEYTQCMIIFTIGDLQDQLKLLLQQYGNFNQAYYIVYNYNKFLYHSYNTKLTLKYKNDFSIKITDIVDFMTSKSF